MLRLERFAAAIARPLIHADRLRPLSWAACSTMARSWSVKRTGTGGPRRLSGSRGGRPVLAIDTILTDYEKMWTDATLSTTIIGMRKRTVFNLCESHAGLGSGYRTAEIVCEGGPAYGSPCAPSPCQILPGADFYAEDCTDEEFSDMVANWAINRQEQST